MATQIYNLTAVPTNLIGANDIDGNPLDLAVGSRYQARFYAAGRQSILKVVEGPTGETVTAAARALPVRVFEDLTIIPAAGQGIFVWSEDGVGELIINDVP